MFGGVGVWVRVFTDNQCFLRYEASAYYTSRHTTRNYEDVDTGFSRVIKAFMQRLSTYCDKRSITLTAQERQDIRTHFRDIIQDLRHSDYFGHTL